MPSPARPLAHVTFRRLLALALLVGVVLSALEVLWRGDVFAFPSPAPRPPFRPPRPLA